MYMWDAEVVKRSDCDLCTAGSMAPSHPEGTGVSSLALHFEATDCQAGEELLKLIRWVEEIEGLKVTELTLLSLKYTWVHFTIFIVHFTPLENSMAANTWERGDLQIILSDEKPAFYQLHIHRSPCPRISGESFIFEPNERTGAVVWQCIQACKTKCQTCKVCAWERTFFFSPSGMFELASDTGMASRWGLKCAPCCLYKAIVCELPTLSLSRKTSFIAAEVRQVT